MMKLSVGRFPWCNVTSNVDSFLKWNHSGWFPRAAIQGDTLAASHMPPLPPQEASHNNKECFCLGLASSWGLSLTVFRGEGGDAYYTLCVTHIHPNKALCITTGRSNRRLRTLLKYDRGEGVFKKQFLYIIKTKYSVRSCPQIYCSLIWVH